jgi:DNA-binding response OmpR family regulator
VAEKVLVVEDELILLETLQYSFSQQGYDVYTAADGLAALRMARQTNPDVIVLDLMLPELDGLEVCQILRREMNTPIIMLTARGEDTDRILGLEMGADDYLTKPFNMRELLARVKAMLRRVRLIRQDLAVDRKDRSEEWLASGDLTIDLSRREVLLQGEPLHLSRREYALLLFFCQNPKTVLSRERILEQVWGWDYGGGSRTVDVHVRWLREKIEPDPANPNRIVTVRGAGYRFEG